MKCYPIIRGCGIAKVGCSLMLFGLAFYIRGADFTLDCDEMRSACPPAFYNLIVANTPLNLDQVEGQKAAETSAYCDCLVSCVNYGTVYENDKSAAEATNCFALTAAAGLPEVAENEPSQGNAEEPQEGSGSGQTTIPGTDAGTCASCDSLQEHADNILTGLAAGIALCGGLLLLTAGCEYLELKWHGKGYAMCVLFTDMVAGFFLLVLTFVAISSALASAIACDPEKFQAAIKDMGADSSNENPDQAAAFVTFFLEVTLPLFKSTCDLKGRLFMACFACVIGQICSFVSFCASCCVCSRMSDDGMDGFDDDHRAVQMHQLMSS